MSLNNNEFRLREYTMADQAVDTERSQFIVRTYVHLLGAVIAFVGIEAALLQLPGVESMVGAMTSGFAWLLVLGAFMFVSYIANRWAHSATSLGTQYLGLGLYVVAEAVIFLPLLYVAANYGGQGVISTAAGVTLCVFTGLTAAVLMTRKNFSFLAPALSIAGIGALLLIVVSILFGFSLGPIFTVAMIVFAAGYILYNTSNILHEYRTDQYVAASLGLFASVALLFWYILQLLMSLNRN